MNDLILGIAGNGKSASATAARALFAAKRSRNYSLADSCPKWRAIWRQDMRDYALCWRRCRALPSPVTHNQNA